jgi:hypothetical protein
VNKWNFIIWEKSKRSKNERPYMQIPLPVQPKTPKIPANNEKDTEKRGVYIFEM